MKTCISIFFFLFFFINLKNVEAQEQPVFTKYDTLRGSLSDLRSYDVKYYDLKIKVDIDKKYLSGQNMIYFTTTQEMKKLQLDLFANMKIESIIMDQQALRFERDSNVTYVYFETALEKNKNYQLLVKYEGYPTIAVHAPWDGGFTFAKTKMDKPWVAVSCEGIGASLWWPCKDHLSDEPDSMRITTTVKAPLFCVSNGKLEATIRNKKEITTSYFVSYPINSYNVTLNIAEYKHIEDTYVSGGEKLNLDYYVLPYNVEKAKTHFAQVKPMLEAYEKYFGRYPFWRDGYKLVETPYLGMEHQSCIAYGNDYKKGYNGMDMSGLGFDYLIIHESGHEWWGNNVSMSDMAEMWLHEGFCTYGEGVYVEHLHGYDKAMQYYFLQRMMIENKEPIVSHYGVNEEPPQDQYYKGSQLLHTLRHITDNDSIWWKLIYDWSTINSPRVAYIKEFEEMYAKYTGNHYEKVFDQYLHYAQIPKLVYEIKDTTDGVYIYYKWEADVKDFDMPVVLLVDGKRLVIHESGTILKDVNANQIKLNFKAMYIRKEEIK